MTTRPSDFSNLNRYAQQAASAVSEFRKAAKQARNNRTLNANEQASQVDQLRQQTRQHIQQLQRQAEQTYYANVNSLQGALAPDAKNDTQAMLSEFRRGRAWDRERELITHKVENEKVSLEAVVRVRARQAALARDIDTLQALREELPSYLETRGYEGPSIKAINAVIEDAYETTFDPKRQQAAADLKTLEKGWKRLQTSFPLAEQSLTHEDDMEDLIPGFGDKDLFKVESLAPPPPELPSLGFTGVTISDREPR